jgi:hypothetical protein
MAQTTINIDDVVREVLAQLGLTASGALSANGKAAANGVPAALPKTPSPAPAPPPQPPRAAAGDGELVVSSRVVALAELKDRLAGVRKLVVPPHAIVTPAVRDELRRRNIALVFGEKSPVAKTTGVRLVLLVARGAMEPTGLIASLENEGIAVELETSDCLIKSTDQLAAELRKGSTLAVLATTYVPAALCLANRLAGVRAVWGADARTVASDTAAVGANLLVVNPAGAGLFQLRQLVTRFYREPRHESPKVFQERLG